MVNPEYCDKCGYIVSQCECEKPKTNAERIRAMSDEELAIFLIEQEEDAVKGELWEYPAVCLGWLQSEVEGN